MFLYYSIFFRYIPIELLAKHPHCFGTVADSQGATRVARPALPLWSWHDLPRHPIRAGTLQVVGGWKNMKFNMVVDINISGYFGDVGLQKMTPPNFYDI